MVLEVCPAGLFSYYNDVVRVMRNRNPSAPVEVLRDEDIGNKDDDPRLAWIGPNELHIELRHARALDVMHRNISGVAISIELQSDNPEQRTVFEKAMQAAEGR